MRILKVGMVNASCIGRLSRIIMTKIKERLKPNSFYGHKLEDMIRAFLQVDLEKLNKMVIRPNIKYFN